MGFLSGMMGGGTAAGATEAGAGASAMTAGSTAPAYSAPAYSGGAFSAPSYSFSGPSAFGADGATAFTDAGGFTGGGPGAFNTPSYGYDSSLFSDTGYDTFAKSGGFQDQKSGTQAAPAAAEEGGGGGGGSMPPAPGAITPDSSRPGGGYQAPQRYQVDFLRPVDFAAIQQFLGGQ